MHVAACCFVFELALPAGAKLLHVSRPSTAASRRCVSNETACCNPTFAGAKLLHVSDLLLLGRATIEESLLLLHWLGNAGHERLGERCAGCAAAC